MPNNGLHIGLATSLARLRQPVKPGVTPSFFPQRGEIEWTTYETYHIFEFVDWLTSGRKRVFV